MNTIHFETIDSTNTYLKQNYKNLDNFTFVSADFQSAGRGRNNRNWKSEKGENLLFSLLIKDESLIKEFRSLSIISALSVIEAINIKDLSIKWPNDVYYKDDKLVGILLEAVSVNKIECLIIGIGVNVNQKEFFGDYKRQPTSLCKILNTDINIAKLKAKVYKQIEYNFNLLKNGYDFYEKIANLDYLKDKDVCAQINNEIKNIKVLGINKDYSLKVQTEKEILNLDTGEITFHI